MKTTTYKFGLLSIMLSVFFWQSTQAQLVPQTVSSTCAPSYSGSVETMGRAGGLTVNVPAGCNNVGWGFDLGTAVHFNFTPSVSYLTIDPCQSNLNRGLLTLTGNRSVTYYKSGGGTNTTSIPVRVTIQFTSNGTNVIPVKQNGDVIFNQTGSAFVVKFTLEANAGNLVSPLWNGASFSTWAPALTLFDNLATNTNGQVFTGLTSNFYKMDTYTFLAGNPPASVTRSQAPTSLPNLASGNNTGIELSAFNSTTGLTYTFANSTGNALCIGFDAATAFGYSYENPGGGSTADVFDGSGRILMFANSSSNLSAGLAVFTGCTPIRHLLTTGAFTTTASIGTQMEVRFQNGAGAAVPAVWKDGMIYMTVASGQSGRINLRMYANASNLTATPFWNGAAMSGLSPALSMFDRLGTENTNAVYGQAHQKVDFKFFDPTSATTGTTLTWTGAVSTAWENPCNWGCRVPTIDDDVIIPASPASARYPLIASTIVGDCKTIDIQGTTPVIDRLTIQVGGILNATY